MPMSSVGMKLMMGCGSNQPNVPSWTSFTVTPSVARIEARKPSVASSGTTIERNTSTSRTNASPTTMARYGASASLSFSDTSAAIAVWPVMPTLTLLDFSMSA